MVNTMNSGRFLIPTFSRWRRRYAVARPHVGEGERRRCALFQLKRVQVPGRATGRACALPSAACRRVLAPASAKPTSTPAGVRKIADASPSPRSSSQAPSVPGGGGHTTSGSAGVLTTTGRAGSSSGVSVPVRVAASARSAPAVVR